MRRLRRDVGRLPQRGRRLDAELAAQQVLADGDLPQRRAAGRRPRRGCAPAARGCPPPAGCGPPPAAAYGDRLGRPAGGQQPDRGLPQPGLDQRGDPVPLHQQPRLERRARRQLQPSSRSSPTSSSGAGSVHSPAAPGDVDGDVSPRTVTTGSPVSTSGRPSDAAQLGQGPAQRAERVVGVGEEQLGEVPAARRPLGEQQVGEQRPRLAAPRRRARARRPARSTGGPSSRIVTKRPSPPCDQVHRGAV